MTVAGTRYTYMQAPWDAPLSLGVQALIEFNDYIINDRYQSDRIRVNSITGLDGPDVTDVREDVPGDEGEFAYQSLYRGRTFVITGNIQAGSLGTCTAMATDLRTAYAPLVEAPMKFRWFDVYDGFTDPQTWRNYTAIIGDYSTLYGLPISGGFLRWNTTSPLLLTRSADNRLWGDVQVTERLVVGGAQDGTQMGVVLAVTDGDDYLIALLDDDPDSPAIEVQTVVGGTSYTICSASIDGLVQGAPVWLRGRREGDMATVELWLSQPTDTALPDYVAQGWLEGSDADAFGDGVLSDVGVYGNAANENWAISDLWVDSIYPGDISFMAKTITKPSIQDAQQQQTVFQRPFQLTLRTSWPYAQSAHQRRSQYLVPSSGNTTQLGFTNPLINPLSASTIIPGSVSLENNILFFQNRGKAPERPILVVFGATGPFALYSLTNGMQLTWSGDLVDGSYLAIDCQNRTITDSTGASQLGYLAFSDSRWMIFEPGWNDLYFVGSNYSSNTRILAFAHDRWI